MDHASEAMSAPPMPQYGILKGPNGLRAGWRLLIFVAILVPLGYGMGRSVDALTSRMHADVSTPLGTVLLLDLFLLPLFIATWAPVHLVVRDNLGGRIVSFAAPLAVF